MASRVVLSSMCAKFRPRGSAFLGQWLRAFAGNCTPYNQSKISLRSQHPTSTSSLQTLGAEPCLRSRQLRSYSRTYKHFMEPEGSLQRSQQPSTGPYPESDQSSAAAYSTYSQPPSLAGGRPSVRNPRTRLHGGPATKLTRLGEQKDKRHARYLHVTSGQTLSSSGIEC
jgi:hypothetical protein